MNSDEVKNQLAVERYLLGELGPEERDAFEDLYFSDVDVATDLRATSLFLTQTKRELARPVPVPIEEPKRSWFSFASLLRPAFAAPALAAMLLVIGFQNFVTVPSLKRDAAMATQPQVLPSVNLVDGGSRGDTEIRTLTVDTDQPFQLAVDVPSQNGFASYQCSLYAPSGKLIWHVSVPPSMVSDTIFIKVPPGSAAAGVNTLLVQGIPAGGQSSTPTDLVRYRFLLQVR